MNRKFFAISVFTVFCFVTATCHADWLRFRGPNGSGISPDSAPTPVKWSPTDSIKWKVELPGPGVSSPIIVGDRVLVTCYSGYGLNRDNPGDIRRLRRHLISVDRANGNLLWERSVKAVQPEDSYSGMGVPSHGYASHTPVSDGKNVYAFFGKTGVLAFDMEGAELWRSSVGTGSDNRRWGSSSSPIFHNDLVIVTASAESRAMVGLHAQTGEEIWRQETEGLTDVWGTPLLAQVNQDRTDLVIGVAYEFWGLNPATGKLRWYSDAMDTDSYNSSVVESSGVVYGIEGRGGGSAAVRIGGKGNVTETHTVWIGNDSARFGTPLVYQGRIYYFANGVANCISADSGKSIFKGRLPGVASSGGRGADGGRPDDSSNPNIRGQRDDGRIDRVRGPERGGFRGGRGGGFGNTDYSSPVAADGKIYFVKNNGTTYVIKAGDDFELLATNQISEGKETFSATPAISDGQFIVRSDKHLYCISDE